MHTTVRVSSELYHEVRGAGPPVLFITGASGDAGHFTGAAEPLADEFTTVAYDRRGCSRSAPLSDAGPMSIAGQAADAASLIEELELAPAIAFGTSGGGVILLDMLARHPEVLRGAVVHEPALIALADAPETGDDPLAPIVERAASDPRGAMEAFVRLHTSDATFESLDPELRERVLANGARFFAQQLPAFGAYVPDFERLRGCGVPIRVLVSDGGTPFLLPVAERLARDLDIDLTRIFGHHAPYLEHPAVFAEELRPILRQLC